MKLWIVLTILGHVYGTWGPQPPDANIGECSDRATAFQSELRRGMWLHPEAKFPGNPASGDITVSCIEAEIRPILTEVKP